MRPVTESASPPPPPHTKPLDPRTIRAMRAAVSGATHRETPAPVVHPNVTRPNISVPSRSSAPQGRAPTPSAHSFLTGLRDIVTPIRGMDPRSFTDTYGPRIHPITGRSSFHTGIDISSPAGTPVIAPSNAVVADIRSNDIYGSNELILAHNRHVESMYGHMSSLAPGLKPGMKIRAGDLIGYVGSEGLSTGPHLHWETWRDNSPVNPMTFLGGQ